MCLCNDGKRKERIALSTLFSLLIVPRVLSILVNVLFSLGYPAGASVIERELLIRRQYETGISPSPSFIFWLSFHFSCSPNRESRSLFFLCPETARKRLLHRLLIDSLVSLRLLKKVQVRQQWDL